MTSSGSPWDIFSSRKIHISSALYLVLLLSLLLSLGALAYSIYFSKAGPPFAKPGSTKERRVTFLTVNDTYRLDGIADGRLGGLHRLRTLRKSIEADAPNVVLLHAGDLLGPSMIADATE